MGDYLLQRKGGDSSHELNLACCQLEGRHLYCRSVRVIVSRLRKKKKERNKFSSKHTFETSQPRVLSLSFEMTCE